MKYKAKQLSNGKWAVWIGKRYFQSTTTDEFQDADYRALCMSGRWHRDQIDKIQETLGKKGYISEYNSDPGGWLA